MATEQQALWSSPCKYSVWNLPFALCPSLSIRTMKLVHWAKARSVCEPQPHPRSPGNHIKRKALLDGPKVRLAQHPVSNSGQPRGSAQAGQEGNMSVPSSIWCAAWETQPEPLIRQITAPRRRMPGLPVPHLFPINGTLAGGDERAASRKRRAPSTTMASLMRTN